MRLLILKSLELLVLLIDFLKGLLSVVLILYYFDLFIPCCSLSLLFAIFSHCFNPWINFKGGRGLATAAGGLTILYPTLLLAWIIIWILVYLIKKDILIANIFATVFSLCFSISKLIQQLINLLIHNLSSVNELLLFTSALLIIIFIKHIEPLKEIIIK